MTNPDKQMPDEIYAGQDKCGDTYWTRKRHEAYDRTDALKQQRYVRADLVEKTKEKSK